MCNCISCICSSFLFHVMLNVTSNCLPQTMHSDIGIFFFSPLFVSLAGTEILTLLLLKLFCTIFSPIAWRMLNKCYLPQLSFWTDKISQIWQISYGFGWKRVKVIFISTKSKCPDDTCKKAQQRGYKQMKQMHFNIWFFEKLYFQRHY